MLVDEFLNDGYDFLTIVFHNTVKWVVEGS